jgi:UDP-2,3-diacylglucosamine pyrophosphatase LpxH
MPAKVKIIISDTHIGAGGADSGNPLDDFTSDELFFEWVHELIDESERTGAEMVFIINGEGIEFLQVPDIETFDSCVIYPPKAYRDVSVAASLRRLEVVHAGHSKFFQALADFLSLGPPRRSVVFLFGNHDPELAYPQVQARIKTFLDARGDKEELVSIGQRYYFEDGVYVEHGNAYTELVNAFTDADHPFDPQNPELIQRPPGSYVVTDYYNRIERQRPWIDGVHPLSSLIFYALAYDPPFALGAIKAFMLASPALLVDVLAAGPEEAPDDLLGELESEPEQALLERLAGDKAFAASFADRVAVAMMQRGAAPQPSVSRLATGPESAVATPPQNRAREIAEFYWQMLEDAALRVSSENRAAVVCFGHTHERVEKKLSSGAIYLNTGTWIWKANFKNSPDAVWHDLIAHPEKYMNHRQLSYARIEISARGKLKSARLLTANEPGPEPEPPAQMPPSGLWAQMILSLHKIVAKITGWL